MPTAEDFRESGSVGGDEDAALAVDAQNGLRQLGVFEDEHAAARERRVAVRRQRLVRGQPAFVRHAG